MLAVNYTNLRDNMLFPVRDQSADDYETMIVTRERIIKMLSSCQKKPKQNNRWKIVRNGNNANYD